MTPRRHTPLEWILPQGHKQRPDRVLGCRDVYVWDGCPQSHLNMQYVTRASKYNDLKFLAGRYSNEGMN
jgi:hypothetical protein